MIYADMSDPFKDCEKNLKGVVQSLYEGIQAVIDSQDQGDTGYSISRAMESYLGHMSKLKHLLQSDSTLKECNVPEFVIRAVHDGCNPDFLSWTVLKDLNEQEELFDFKRDLFHNIK